MAKKNKKSKNDGMVYSTNQNYEFENIDDSIDTLPPGEQNLKVIFEKKGRGGKQVTLIRDFVGNEDDLKDLGKLLKVKCGTGGSVSDGEILIQGDARSKIMEILKNKGYKAKLAGG